MAEEAGPMPAPPSMSTLLAVTLGLTSFSLLCTLYSLCRTLWPLLPAHPLSLAPRQPHDKRKKRLKSAQRFTVWLACVDGLAVAALIWEVASVSSLGDSTGSVARLFFAVSARPTLLLAVALLSYLNVVRGKPVLLGRIDIVVWLPSLVILAAGTGAAAGIGADSVHVWQFLLGWSIVIAAIVVFCFSRLLLAVIRVRRQQALLHRPMMTEAGGRSSPYLPPVAGHAAISTTFLQPEPEPRPSMASDRSLPFAFLSIDPAQWNMHNYPQSITPRSVSFDAPGSARPLTSPAPTQLGFNTADGLPRPSMSSYHSTWEGGAANLVGAGRLVTVGLSRREARKASARMGGHIAGCVTSLACLTPFAVAKMTDPASPAPLAHSILLAVAVTIGGPMLALQVAFSEGFLYRRPNPTLPTTNAELRRSIDTEKSTTAAPRPAHTVESKPKSRPASRAASIASFHSAASTFHNQPGIIPGTQDVDANRKSRFSRTLSMLEPHPKLQLLPSGGGLTQSEWEEARRRQRAGSVSTFRSSFDDGRSYRSAKTIEHKKHTPEPSPHISRSAASSPFSIDYLSSQILPALVPSVSIGSDTIVKSEPPPLPPMQRNSFGVAVTSSPQAYTGSNGTAQQRRRNWKQLSLPNIDRSAYTTFSSPTAEAVERARASGTDLQSKQAARRRSWKTKADAGLADEWIDLATLKTSTPSSKGSSPPARSPGGHRVTQSLDETKRTKLVTSSSSYRPTISVPIQESEEEPTQTFGTPSPQRRGVSPAPPPSASSSMWTGIDDNGVEELDDAVASTAPSRSATPFSMASNGGPSPSPLSMHPLGLPIALWSSSGGDETEDDDDDVPLSLLRARPTSTASGHSTTSSLSLRPVSVVSTDSGHAREPSRPSSVTSLGFRNMLEHGHYSSSSENDTGASGSGASVTLDLPPTPTRGGNQRRSALRPLMLLSNNVQATTEPAGRRSFDLKPPRRSLSEDEGEEGVILYAQRASHTFERASYRSVTPTTPLTDFDPSTEPNEGGKGGSVVSFGRHRRRESAASLVLQPPPAAARPELPSKQFDSIPVTRAGASRAMRSSVEASPLRKMR